MPDEVGYCEKMMMAVAACVYAAAIAPYARLLRANSDRLPARLPFLFCLHWLHEFTRFKGF